MLYRPEGLRLLPKPRDVPGSHIAYNPSGIWTVNGRDILYARVEPDRSDSLSSHLGNSVIRPYLIIPGNPDAELEPYHDAPEMVGEDAALTRVNRRLGNGALEQVWLLSYVDPKPKRDKPNEVDTLCTRFWCGPDLAKLEHIADGPEWMKDIRIANGRGPLGTELGIYGRPQTEPDSGNITYAPIDDIYQLTPEVIADAPYIDEGLLAIGSGIWGGVNDVIGHRNGVNLLLAHKAWRDGPGGIARHYRSVMYEHDTATNGIIDLGVFATASMFPMGTVKDDLQADLSDVVFTGGGYNGGLKYMTFGVRDGSIGICRSVWRSTRAAYANR